MNKNIVIFDLDGCLTDHDWRWNKIDHSIEDLDERYREYCEQAHLDKPINGDVLNSFIACGFQIVIITARQEKYQLATIEYIADHFKIYPKGSLVYGGYHLLMRPPKNYDTSPKLKSTLLNILNYDPTIVLEEIICAFDDRKDVLEMYRNEFGIPAIYLGADHRLPDAHDCQPTTEDLSTKELLRQCNDCGHVGPSSLFIGGSKPNHFPCPRCRAFDTSCCVDDTSPLTDDLEDDDRDKRSGNFQSGLD